MRLGNGGYKAQHALAFSISGSNKRITLVDTIMWYEEVEKKV